MDFRVVLEGMLPGAKEGRMRDSMLLDDGCFRTMVVSLEAKAELFFELRTRPMRLIVLFQFSQQRS